MAQLVPGETATVVVEVRSIASRPVRRRGMRPLVEATVADGSGSMKATFFNQPWLAQRYPAGTRLVLHGKYEARNRFRVQGHAQTAAGDRRGADGEWAAHYPATEGLSSTQILALVRAHAGVARRRARAAARPRCGCTSGCPSAGRAGRDALRRRRRAGPGAPPAGLRGAAAGPAGAAAPPAAAQPRRRGAPALDGPPRAERPLAGRDAPVHAHRRSAAGDGGDRRRPGVAAADAAAADGRGRLGQDGGRPVRAAAGGRAGLPGRADGARPRPWPSSTSPRSRR